MSQGVLDGIGHAGGARNRSAFTNTFGPQRRERGGVLQPVDLDVGYVQAGRFEIVHEAGGEQLAVVVVAELFEQRRADTVRGSAVDHALDDARVELRATVVDHHVLQDAHLAGASIDRDQAAVGRVGVDQLTAHAPLVRTTLAQLLPSSGSESKEAILAMDCL